MTNRKLNKKKVAMAILLVVVVMALGIYAVFAFVNDDQKQSATKKQTATVQEKKEGKKEEPEVALTISFAGDCTLGNYAGQAYDGSFNQEYVRQGNDPSYFLKNVKDVFAKDDLTVVNLEGPITTSSSHVEKQFPFSGKPEYVQILTNGSVEAVSVANNHSEDYYSQGLSDTKNYLNEASIGYFGYDDYYVKDIKGIKCGFLGYRSLSLSMNNAEGQAKIKAAITHLKEQEQCQLVFVYYHWGIEKQYYANDDQRSLAHFTIDAGADAVIGSHPHVVQGTETYQNKPIIYSLGNFCFGGNRNPGDTDSMIYQLSYTFKGSSQTGYQVNIIPCAISSSQGRNDYQPKLLSGSEAQRVLDKISKYSY